MSEEAPYFQVDVEKIIDQVGKERSLQALSEMVNIRQFETRAEASYLQGKIGGFFHSYMGQEAIQTAAVFVFGQNQWFTTTYRCHALALLLGESPESLIAELFGKVTGNAKGRGGSMHMYSKRMLGGFGIVGGHIPVATGAALTCSYLNNKEISLCFLGDGALAQGTFHESLNIASLWNLPCIYIVENNKWSMGTPLQRTISNHETFLENAAKAYSVSYFKLEGMNFFHTYGGFQEAFSRIQKERRPIIIECMTERFRGHSISDPGLYRSKETLHECMEKDPIPLLKSYLIKKGWLTEEIYMKIEDDRREEIKEAIKKADVAPWPEIHHQEDEVFYATY